MENIYDEEIWRKISGSDYEISNCGNVRNRDKRIIKPQHNNYGYLHVSLRINGSFKTMAIHTLVGKAFVVNPNNYHQLNHIDGNKENNNYTNLEWCTQRQNNCHAIKTNLRRCKNIYMIKDDIVIKMFKNRMEIDQYFGRKLCQDSITRVCNGKRKRAYGYEWRYQ